MLGRISSLLAVGVMAACTAQGPSLNAQAEQMELALIACKDQLGFAGQTQTEVSFDGGIAAARVVPFDQITAADAAKINACAGGVTTLEDGMQVVPLSGSVLPAAVVDVAPVAPIRKPGECPRGRAGLYGGTSYCFGATH